MRHAVLLLVLVAARAGAEGTDTLAPGGLGAGPAVSATQVRDAMTEMAKPFSETRLKRFEDVFFISLPFSALYASLLTVAGGFALEGKRFRLDTPYLAFSMSLAAAGAALVAARDTKGRNAFDFVPAAPLVREDRGVSAEAETPTPPSGASSTAPVSPAATTATAMEPSSTVLR